MKRIFYFTGHRMSMLHWSGKQFVGACSFEPNDEGFAKFEHYLQSSAKIPAKMLIDMIEEDFRIESIPHVYGKDRAAVIERIIDRYYRASKQFTYSEIIAREKHGRRDNRVLLGAITNPELIQPWLDIVEACDIPLSGIWSLPLVSKQILPLLGAKKGPVLLVSQQVNSNLRQTFFRNGKMITSRQSVVNLDADGISKLAEVAKPEVERTIKFLRSQDLIRSDEALQLHILAADEQIELVSKMFASTKHEQVTVHRIRELEENAGFKGGYSKFADVLFAWTCQSLMQVSGHYGKRSDKKRYHYTLLAAGLYAASIAILVTGLLLTESYISEAIQHKKASELLAEQESKYRQVYKRKFEAYEEVFANAGVMNSAVDLARQIQKYSKVTPLDMMIELSRIIEKASLTDVTIDSISWEAEQVKSVQDKKRAVITKPDILSEGRLRHVAVIDGRLSVPANDYSASVDRINDIIDALTGDERIEQAEAIKMPVEVRSDKKFTAESGIKPDRRRDGNGEFSLRIVMKGIDDA